MTPPYLGLDIGLARTGVALSESGVLAQPLTVLEAKPPHMTGVVQEILKLIAEYEARTLVIGVPYSEDESSTSQALKVEQIISQIEAAIKEHGLEVEIVRSNEYHSTQDASVLYPHVASDAAAAALILQDQLDHQPLS